MLRARRSEGRSSVRPFPVDLTSRTGSPALDLRRALRRRRRRSGVDVWRTIEDRADPSLMRPALAEDIEVKHFREREGHGYLMVANPRDLVHLRIPEDDKRFLDLMDGTRTVAEIVAEAFEGDGDLQIDPVVALVLDLHEGGFLQDRFVDVPAIVARRLDPRRDSKLRVFAKTLTVYWNGADRFVRWMYERGLRRVMDRRVLIPSGVVAIVGLVAFIMLVTSDRVGPQPGSLAVEGLIILALNYLLVFIHELAHATVLVHHGRRIKSAGFQIYFGSPAFLVESSDVLMLDKAKRVQQASAGVFAESVFAGIASLVAIAVPDSVVGGVLYRFATLNYFYIFLNLVPLLELDGYWILSDVLGIPDLRARALRFVRRDMWSKLRRRERLTRRDVGLGLYGIVGVGFSILAFVWSFFFWRHLFGGVVARMWNGGGLSRAFLIVLAVIIGGPLIRGLVALGKAAMRQARALAAAVRFMIQRSWRVEAAELIREVPLFGALDDDTLSDLAGRVALRRASPGEVVVRQGEPGTSFFVVRAGTLEIVEEATDGSERLLRVVGRGDAFGEVAVVEARPRRATVRAREHAQVFEIDKGTFDRLLAETVKLPDFAPTMQDLADVRALPTFAHLEPDQVSLLLEHGSWIDVAPGERIIKQGEKGDAFYVIGSGQVEVVRSRHVVGTLGPGEHFGELALLSRAPRAATVRALTPVRVFRLDRKGFDRWIRGAFKRGAIRTRLVGRAGRTSGKERSSR